MKHVVSAALALAVAFPLDAQAPASKKHDRRWEVAGIPALNFDADEGFGYGAILELYNYGDGAVEPYAFTIQPNLLFTTGGRRDVSLFLDAPKLLPGGWRITATASREQQLATPYYGVGNQSVHDTAREAAPNNYYYRYGHVKRVLSADLQRKLPRLPIRVLGGARISTATLDAFPFDSGTTLLASELPASGEPMHGWWNAVRAGLVYDTRDREVGPRRGTWSDVLVQRYLPALGSERDYTRWTVTDRRYYPLGRAVVYAQRVLLQGASGDVPVHDLATVQTSFKGQEGLGGAKTVRGLPRNRYQGKGLLLVNSELRWRAADFRLLRAPSHLVLTTFADAGRVWAGNPRLGEVATGVHVGYGAGARLGMGDSFLIAVDVGRSSQVAAAPYIGLGYLF